ncbi:hypothetical protein [Humisphaera borealis]|uniref:Uncharacterized protein n=1 Tax=Humisphaera borealis TaxID=2807512 RepID=A0A7M2WVB6_9BACT|nr:hypothetical protein [Humisphaera borealis]QOV89329.1 hypothetical protein IPV69_24495 [Humisphaera borealis]
MRLRRSSAGELFAHFADGLLKLSNLIAKDLDLLVKFRVSIGDRGRLAGGTGHPPGLRLLGTGVRTRGVGTRSVRTAGLFATGLGLLLWPAVTGAAALRSARLRSISTFRTGTIAIAAVAAAEVQAASIRLAARCFSTGRFPAGHVSTRSFPARRISTARLTTVSLTTTRLASAGFSPALVVSLAIAVRTTRLSLTAGRGPIAFVCGSRRRHDHSQSECSGQCGQPKSLRHECLLSRGPAMRRGVSATGAGRLGSPRRDRREGYRHDVPLRLEVRRSGGSDDRRRQF